MKFSKSDRDLNPQTQFTPPCNYYDPSQAQNKPILTGSLAGPTLNKQHALFGLQKRFKQISNDIGSPGPGAYYNGKQDKSAGIIEQRSKLRQARQQAFIGVQSKSPSIPFNQNIQDEQQLQYARELLMNEDINKSALSLKRKTQGFTFSKTTRTYENKTNSQHKAKNPLQSITEYTEPKLNRPSKIEMIEKVKKSNQKRQQIMNLVNPQFVPSLELIQIVTKRRTKYNPGPGAYNYHQYKQTQTGIPFTTAKRFSEDSKLRLGPGQYQIFEQKKKSLIFNKSARHLFNMKNQTDLEHRFYIDPLKNIKENDSVIKTKTSSTHPFGSQVTRFSKLQKQQAPPQYYKVKKMSKLEQVVQKRLKNMQKKHTHQSEGLLGISTMASTIQ